MRKGKSEQNFYLPNTFKLGSETQTLRKGKSKKKLVSFGLEEGKCEGRCGEIERGENAPGRDGEEFGEEMAQRSYEEKNAA